MKERTLLLCIAYPEISKKYEIKFCMAGITENGEFRRIYPVPANIYRRMDFHKRWWIEYELLGQGDHRKESKKINPRSIRIGEEVSYDEVREILEEKVSTIEELNEMKEKDDTSIGIIKPIVKDFQIREEQSRAEQKKQIEKQKTIYGRRLPIRIIPHWLGYEFKCDDNCNGHRILCEDIEVGQLYWNCLKQYEYMRNVETKMRQKLVSWMQETRDLYFMLGTHFRWGTWLIISILYPPKMDKKKNLTLEEFL